MPKNRGLLIWILVTVSIISVTLNIICLDGPGFLLRLSSQVPCLFRSCRTPLNRPYAPRGNEAVVLYLLDATTTRVARTDSKDGKSLPKQLVMEPGVYNVLGANYPLTREGLYRFILPGETNLQRIVYRDDVHAFLSAISWIVTHGNLDDRKSNTELTDKALHSKLFLTCGETSRWSRYLLNNSNVKSRMVMGMTVEAWNDYDNGHTLIEVWRSERKKWVVYDLDNNSYFKSKDDDNPLSLLEFSRSAARDDYRIVSLSCDTVLDASNFSSPRGYNYSFIAENIATNIRAWYRKVMQVPLIMDKSSKQYLFMDDRNRDRIESYSPNYKYLNKDEFIKRFYGFEGQGRIIR